MNIVTIIRTRVASIRCEAIKEELGRRWLAKTPYLATKHNVDLLKFIEHQPSDLRRDLTGMKYSLDLCNFINQQLNGYIPALYLHPTHSTMDQRFGIAADVALYFWVCAG